MKVLCNRCGLGSMVQCTWLPNMSLGFECLNCGDAEILYMGPNDPKEDVPLDPEEQKVIQDILKKKAGTGKDPDEKN